MGDAYPNQNSNSYYRNPTFYCIGTEDPVGHVGSSFESFGIRILLVCRCSDLLSLVSIADCAGFAGLCSPSCHLPRPKLFGMVAVYLYKDVLFEHQGLTMR